MCLSPNCQSTLFWKGFWILGPHGLKPTRLICQWDFSAKNTGVACHSLLQGIFQTQGENPSLSHCRQILYHLSHQQSPLRLNELLGWNTDSVGLVSSWSETPEKSLCVSVFFILSLFPTHHPVWRCMENPAWEEIILTRTSPCWHLYLGLLAPRTVRIISVVYSTVKINFCSFHWVYCILL